MYSFKELAEQNLLCMRLKSELYRSNMCRNITNNHYNSWLQFVFNIWSSIWSKWATWKAWYLLPLHVLTHTDIGILMAYALIIGKGTCFILSLIKPNHRWKWWYLHRRINLFTVLCWLWLLYQEDNLGLNLPCFINMIRA